MAHLRFTDYSPWFAEISDNILFLIWLFPIRIYKVLPVSISIIVSLWFYVQKKIRMFVLTNTSTITLH
jgi:hypothetical protein